MKHYGVPQSWDFLRSETEPLAERHLDPLGALALAAHSGPGMRAMLRAM